MHRSSAACGQVRTSRGRAVSLLWAAVLLAGIGVTAGPPGTAYAAGPTVVADGVYNVAEDNTLTVDAMAGVLANDTNTGEGTMTATQNSGAGNGTATLSSDGSFTYVPSNNYVGMDSFTYTATDDSGTSAPVQVSLNVTAVDDPPVPVDDSASATAGTPVVILVLINDSDIDTPGPLFPHIVNPTTKGPVSTNPDGTITYSPLASATGTDTFTYGLSNGGQEAPSIRRQHAIVIDEGEDTATVTITIRPAQQPNNAPIAADDSASTTAGVPVTVTVPGVLGNDSDPDGHVITAVLVAGPGHGTVTLDPNGTFTYNPAAGFTGNDTFTYQASDGLLLSNIAKVTIGVSLDGNGEPPPVAPQMCEGVLATIVGTAGDDIIVGTPGTDVIVGLGGNDRINGVGGHDHICGGDGNDLLQGGSGRDRLVGGEGLDRLYGGSGIDRLYGGPGNDFLRGDASDDKLYGGTGVDRINGDTGDDLIMGDDGDDKLYGGSGRDRIYGGHDNDLLRGGPANDRLYGQQGKDRLYGDGGNDRLVGGPAHDLLNGGTGTNVLQQ
jgi:VCBS repeat-containing protein